MGVRVGKRGAGIFPASNIKRKMSERRMTVDIQ